MVDTSAPQPFEDPLHRWHECERKKRYSNFEGADLMRLYWSRGKEDATQTYQCSFCGFFHWGHKPGRKAEFKRADQEDRRRTEEEARARLDAETDLSCSPKTRL